MSNIPYRIKMDIEEIFDMTAGSVLNFSNRSFQEFIGDVVGIDVYEKKEYEEYPSKAKKLRRLFQIESDYNIGKVLTELLHYTKDLKSKEGKLTDYYKEKIEELLLFSSKLMGNDVGVELPKTEEETLQTLVDDIKGSLSKNKPSLVLDRLHTFSTKFIRQICEKNGITVTNPKGEYFPIHSLVGMLRKFYESNNVFQSEFTLISLQNSISLFDRFNSIRNNQSFAHDNEILSEVESDYVIKTMANVLMFIDKIENIRGSITTTTTTTTTDDFLMDSIF